MRSSSSAICGEGDHLRGEQVDEERHEEALALDLFGVALAEDFFEEDALVGYVLVDDPEAFFVGGEDEGVAELAQGFEGGEGVEGVGLRRGLPVRRWSWLRRSLGGWSGSVKAKRPGDGVGDGAARVRCGIAISGVGDVGCGGFGAWMGAS